MRFVDTNVLLYAISSDPAETAKAERAAALLNEPDLALSVQVLQEFYAIATRKLNPPLPPREAALQVQRLCAFQVMGSTAQSVQAAIALAQEHQLHWWDALILEAALRALPRPVIGHIASDALWLDLRCLEVPDLPAFTAQLPALADALAQE